MSNCPNDTNGDGDCHLCHRTPGGCLNKTERSDTTRYTYLWVRDEFPEHYSRIVGFVSTLDIPLEIRAEVEKFCMGLVRSVAIEC